MSSFFITDPLRHCARRAGSAASDTLIPKQGDAKDPAPSGKVFWQS